MRLNAEDHRKIELAASTASARTHMHIAVSVVPASDRYALYPLVWGALLALTAGGILALVDPAMPIREAFAIEAGVFLLASILIDWFPLRLFFVPRHIRHAHATTFAHRAFAAGASSEKHEQGRVLIFVSLAERYAEVIGDRTAHARLGHVWDHAVATIVTSARAARITDGILEAIDEIGNAAQPVN